jgi:membrane-associated protease RseP (regulator of RpoE activity)
LFVTPNERFAEPISADRSGLLIRPHAQGAVVKSIASDSAGARLELRVADIIASIDDEPVTYANISKLKRVLASDREIVPICWLSGDQPRCGELALASRFDQREGR